MHKQINITSPLFTILTWNYGHYLLPNILMHFTECNNQPKAESFLKLKYVGIVDFNRKWTFVIVGYEQNKSVLSVITHNHIA